MVEIKSSLLNDCQKEFQAKDLYAVLNLDKTASTAEIKKAYYKLSLKYHPDKASSDRKDECTIKFQLLCKIYSILSDEEKKKVYDDTGCIDGEDDFFTSVNDWDKYWRQIFKKISANDIKEFYKKYINSSEERNDLIKSYMKNKGNFDLIVMDIYSDDILANESRLRDILNEAIKSGEIEAYDAFVKESDKKATKRKAKYENEAAEAEEIRKELGVDESQESLRNAILSKKKEVNSDKFLDQLASKYCKTAKGKAKAKISTKHSRDEDEDEEADESIEDDEDDEEEEEEVTKKPRRHVSRVAAKPSPKVTSKSKRVKRL